MSQQTTQKTFEVTPIVGKIEGTELQVYNWHGFKIIVGQGKSTFILDEIQYRRKRVKQNMMIVVGAPGEGKSYFALRLSEILDPNFNPYKQIVFERTHLLWLLGPTSPLKMGQVILIDEAQFIAGARRWYEDIQKDVMEHIEAIRSRGFIVIIVALHINLLDKIIRKYVLSHMALMRERGKAVIYSLWTPPFIDKLFRRTLGNMSLQIPSYDQCKFPSCLLCKYQSKCTTVRAIYERLKKEFLGAMSTQSQQKAAAREQRKRVIDYNDMLQKVTSYKDKFVYSQIGNVEPESVKLVLEENYGIMLNDREVSRVIKRGRIKMPEVFKKQKQIKPQTKKSGD